MRTLIRMGGLTLMLAAATGAGAATQGGQDGPRGMRRHGPGGRDGLASYLELTQEQQAQWKTAHEQLRTTTEGLRTQAHDARKQMETALEQARPDPATVGKLAITMHSIHKKMRAAHEATEAQLAASLTPEQKTKFDAFKAARGHGRFGGRGHGGFGHPDGPPPGDGPSDEEQ
jgi:Spy/CpxP family protein refolding chaperone